jgi:hypothetical protein
MNIARFIQRKVERLLGRDVLAESAEERPPQTARLCSYGHAVFSGNNLCSYGHRAA